MKRSFGRDKKSARAIATKGLTSAFPFLSMLSNKLFTKQFYEIRASHSYASVDIGFLRVTTSHVTLSCSQYLYNIHIMVVLYSVSYIKGMKNVQFS